MWVCCIGSDLFHLNFSYLDLYLDGPLDGWVRSFILFVGVLLLALAMCNLQYWFGGGGGGGGGR